MATTIKATCANCGNVYLTPQQVRLVVSNVNERSHYSFTCPGCQDTVSKPANNEVIRLLRVGGVIAEHLTIPAEVLEMTSLRDTPPLSTDDLLDFTTALTRLGEGDIVAMAQNEIRG